MNISSVIGVIGGILIIVTAIQLQISDNPGMSWLGSYFDPTGVFIVFGGLIMATFLKSSLSELKALPAVLKQCFIDKVEDPTEIIQKLVELATIARKDGLIALESQEIKNEFMGNGIRMLIDGAKPEIMRQTLSGDLTAMKLRHKHSVSVVAYMGEVAPAMGMIGTLVGLVGLLSNMADVASLGKNMATAVLTTFYGAFLANALFLPISNKLAVLSDLESLNRTMIIEGIEFIQAGGNPRVLEDQLSAYLAPKIRPAT